jgi:transporter family-2 protein
LSGAQFSQLRGLQNASIPQLLSGLGMAFYVISITYLAPRFGVGNSIMFVVAAQIMTAATIDHFGLLGVARHPIDALRALGIAVMIVGVAVTQVAASAAQQRS